MNNYAITFVSLRAGTVYTLSIGGGTGTPIPLKGAAQPFVTQEDDTDDMFTPVRTQSGYIRIVDDGRDANGNTFDWRDLMPKTGTERPVTLSHVDGGETVIDWVGYMQAQNFSGVLYGGTQEREFPVQCPLISLSASFVNTTNRELKNFAYIIKQAFANLPGFSLTNYIFQGGALAREILLKKVDWQNFITVGENDAIEARYDNLRMLTDLCSFWGWTCRVHGNCVYFTCADDNDMGSALLLTPSDLQNMANGTSAGTISQSFLYSVDLTGDIFANMQNEEATVRGINKATVSADANAASHTVLEAFPPSVEKVMSNNGTHTEQYTDCYAVYSTDITDFDTPDMIGTCGTGNASFNKMLVKNNISDPGSGYNVIRIKKTFTSQSAAAFASFETSFHHSYYDTAIQNGGFDTGGITINGDVFRMGKRFEDYDAQGVGRKHIYIRVGIGVDRAHALWWTGSTWSSTVSAVQVRVGSETAPKSLLSINTNHVNLYGKLFVDFLGSNDIPENNGQRRFELVNFSLTFERRTVKYLLYESTRVSSRDYVATNANIVRDEWNADCIYASDNDLDWGYGVIMDDDGKWLETITYDDTAVHPEQHLANRVAAYGETSKRRISVEMRTDVIDEITPQNTVQLNGTTCYPIAIGHDWHDDITMITMLEIPSN